MDIKNAAIVTSMGISFLYICCGVSCDSDPEKEIERYYSYEMMRKAGWVNEGGGIWLCPGCKKKGKAKTGN